MSEISRRSLLIAGAGGLAFLSAGEFPSTSSLDRAIAATTSRAITTAGTTLEQVATRKTSAGYSRLFAGPGYPLMVRQELATAGSRRDDRREPVASIVQMTDLHLVDAQSPVRFEFTASSAPSFFRPHEALGTQATSQLINRINQLAVGPFGGRAFDCVVTTGDNSDNGETLEMEWFLTLMNGGAISADSGYPDEWEGVQSTGDELYYNPELDVRDRYKKAGFPQLPGLLSAAMAEHFSLGLKSPWYSVFGNHDDSIGGSVPSDWQALADMYTGTTKFTGFTDDPSNDTLEAVFDGFHPRRLRPSAHPRTRWQVTADERRAPFTPTQFMAAHINESATGPGPVGHGFTPEAAAAGVAYYTFRIASGVTGVALDTTNRAGYARGSIGEAQLAWLERTLTAGSSRYFDAAGSAARHPVADELFVLFSHHTIKTMDNLVADPSAPNEKRHTGTDVAELVHRFPNVLAWVNGHTHSNNIKAHAGSTAVQGFWEINTASHIDFPQQARVIEVCDNNDGTLSLFTTLIESAAPVSVSYDDRSPLALASLYRELGANNIPHANSREGSATDRNTELLLVNPLA